MDKGQAGQLVPHLFITGEFVLTSRSDPRELCRVRRRHNFLGMRLFPTEYSEGIRTNEDLQFEFENLAY
jgi:hypothetical protein